MNRLFKALFESIFAALSTVGLLALITPALLGEDSTPPYSQLVLTFLAGSVCLSLYLFTESTLFTKASLKIKNWHPKNNEY